MILADQIVEILSSSNGVLSEALIKTKVLLHQIGQKDLVHWVNKELNGYSDDDTLPDYRIVDAQVLVNASNIAYEVSRHPIPLGHLDENYRKSLERGKMPQSLAIIEEFASANKESSLESLIPIEAYGLLGKGLVNQYKIQKAWSEVQITSVANILMQVRSRLLDFVLEINTEFSHENSAEKIKEKASHFDAKNLFNHTIFGDNTTIVVGSENTQKIQNTITENDFDALKEELINHGMSDTDIDALKIAIDSDTQIVNPEKINLGQM